jgi:signal transduction histidine kinase
VRRLGFAARLGLATSALVVVVCVTQSWLLSRGDVASVGGWLEDRGRTVGERLAEQAGAALLTGNVDALRMLGEQARLRDGIGYTRFFDANGLLLVSIGSSGTAAALRPEARRHTVGPIVAGGDTWEFQAPVAAGAGVVAVGVPLGSLHAIRVRALTTASFVTGVFTLLGVLAAALLARAITRPLRALAVATDAIAAGDLSARVTAEGKDEVADLARSFNAMVESVARSRMSLEEKVVELEEANRLKSEFLATASHELRTPLNVILGYADMLADGGPLAPEAAQMVASIRRYTTLQLDLVTRVLDFSRLSAGQVAFHVERFALAPLLEELQALSETRARERGLRLMLALDRSLPELLTDRVKLQEILRNLIDNALKFTSTGRITIRARVAETAGRVAIEVADTGPGIAPEEAAHVFDPFHQLGASSTRSTGGVGLGLSIVKSLAEALGGSVALDSRPGEGSTFRVELPCVLPEAAASALEALDGVTRNAAAVADRPPRRIAVRRARNAR